ncbi:MAG: hypothetical protein R3B06_09340 [Kofleriaceae bacterium]
MIGPVARGRELAGLVDEFAPAAWRRDPAWWAIIATAAAVEPWAAKLDAPYLASNAEPATDTFMAAETVAPASCGAWCAWAVTAAHAAVRAVVELDGTLPGQPLAVTVSVVDGVARTAPVATPWRVGFAVGARVVGATLDPRGPAHDGALVTALADVAAGRATALGPDPTPPLVVVAVGDDALATLRHGHRRAWHGAAAGPWLGVARVGSLTAVTTCHLVIDGYGHARVTQEVVGATVPAALAAVAAAIDDRPLPRLATAHPPGTELLGVAWRHLPRLPPTLPLAYALGRVLHQRRGDPRAARSPSFQLPVARGAVDDPARFAHRVRPAMLAVRYVDGACEPLEAFAARAKAAIAREAGGRGIATRLLATLAVLPVPTSVKRASVRTGPTRWLRGPREHLAGDAGLSALRLPGPVALIAASSPSPQIPRARGNCVVTVVRHDRGATVTVASLGRLDPTSFLDQWLAEVARVTSE